MVNDNTGGSGTYDPQSNTLVKSDQQEKVTATRIEETRTSVRAIDYGKNGTTGFVGGGTIIRGGGGNPNAYSVTAPSKPSGELSTATYIGEAKDLTTNPTTANQKQTFTNVARAINNNQDIYTTDTGLLMKYPQGYYENQQTPFYTTFNKSPQQESRPASTSTNGIDLTKPVITLPSEFSKYSLPLGMTIEEPKPNSFLGVVDTEFVNVYNTTDFLVRQPIRSIIDIGSQGLNFISDLNKSVGNAYGTTDLSKSASVTLPAQWNQYALKEPILFNDKDYAIPFTDLVIGSSVITEGVGLIYETGASAFKGAIGTGSLQDTENALIIGGGAIFPELSAPILLGFGGETISQGFKEGGAKGTAEVLLGGAMIYGGANEFNDNFKLSTSDLKSYDKFANEYELKDLELRERPSGYFYTEDVGGVRKYLLGLDKYGNYISIGGKMEVGETSLQGLFREAKEETAGTITKDILSNIQYKGTVKTPEEMQQVFTAQLPQDILSIVKPSSDIVKFELVEASKLKDIFQSKENIVRGEYYAGYFDKLFGNSKNIRIAEVNIINRIENIKELGVKYNIGDMETFNNLYSSAIDKFSNIKSIDLTAYSKKGLVEEFLLYKEGKLTKQLGIKTPKGILEFYTQSRYDVPLSTQEKFFQETIDKFTYTKGVAKFEGEVLNINAGKDIFNSQIDITLRGDKKAFKNPQLLVSGTGGELELNKLGNLEIKPELSKRGGAGFYFQTPTVPSGRGYIGSSYFLGGETEYEVSLFPKATKSTVLYGKFVLDNSILKYADEIKNMKSAGLKIGEIQDYVNTLNKEGRISPTAKTILGIEEEAAIYKGSFKFEGNVQKEILQGRVTEFKNIKRIQPSKDVAELYKARDNANAFSKSFIGKQIESKTGINPIEFERPNIQTRYISVADKLLYGSEENKPKQISKYFGYSIKPMEKFKETSYKLNSGYGSVGETFKTPKENIKYGQKYSNLFKANYNVGESSKYVPTNSKRKITTFDFDYLKKRTQKLSKRKGGKEDIAYTPSFTAQALGIKSYVSKSDIFKRASKSMTGAELRGVLIAR